MNQPTLFTFANERPVERKRKIETFDTFNLATRYAIEARGSGKYDDVYVTREEPGDNIRTVVVLEWIE